MPQESSTFLRPIATCRKQWMSKVGLQLLFGILVGALLGFCAKFDYETKISTLQLFPLNGLHLTELAHSDYRIKCVIFIHPKQKFKTKYVQALRDTYTKQCNSTIYITNSYKIRKQFREELNVAFVQTSKTHYHWDLFREILKFSTKHDKNETSNWTIFGDEQTFIVMANLRRILTFHNPKQPLILGKISTMRTLLSYAFPLAVHTVIHPQGGIVFSSNALERITNDECFGWLTPRNTERALIRCSKKMKVQLMDPTDQYGMHLFNSENLKTLIMSSSSPLSMEKKRAQCCSNRAVSFGGMNYRQHRMVDFLLTKIKVFGLETLQ